VIASYKHSSLLSLVVNDEGKKFCNIDTSGYTILKAGNTNLTGRASTVDFLIEMPCFVKKGINDYNIESS
jgi:hypothetical protein